MRVRAYVLLFALGGVWGASFLFIKVIVGEIAPLELVTARLALGAIAVLAFMRYRRLRFTRSPAQLGRVAFMALLSNVAPFSLIAWAEVHIDSGVASVLNSSMPLFTSLFAAALLTEESFTPTRVLGLIAGFVGVVVLTGGDIVEITDSSVLGQIAVVGAAACYGGGAVFARVLLRSEEPLGLSGLQLTFGALIAFALTLGIEGVPDYTLSTKGWLALASLGLLATGLGYAVYLWLVDNLGSVRASLVTYIVPVVGLLLGWAVLDESIGLNTALGAALIIAGVAAVVRGQAPVSQRTMPAAAVAE